MKALIAPAAAILFAIVPAAAHAQSQQHGLTRAQVIQELVDLESVGYSPSAGNDASYPDDVLAAQQRLADKRYAEAQAAKHSYGPNGNPASAAGKAVD